MNQEIHNYTQEDVNEFCSDIYLDFFIDLIESKHILNLNTNELLINIISTDAINLLKLFESKGLFEWNKEKVIGWLIYAYCKESYSIINYIKSNYFNKYIIDEHDKTYFIQNCLVALSEYGKLDIIIELDNLYQINWLESIIIDKELGDKINNLRSMYIILSELEINNRFGFETPTYNSFSLGNKILGVVCTYSHSFPILFVLEFFKFIESKINTVDKEIIQNLFSRSFEFDNLEFSQYLYSLGTIDIKEEKNNPLLAFFSPEYCNQIDLFKWLGTLDKRKDVLNTILLKLASSHCYPKISQQTKLDIFKYFIDLGASIFDNYDNLFMGCFTHGDYLVLEYLSNSNYEYDYTQIFQLNNFINSFTKIYNIGIYCQENNHTFISDELQLFNDIRKCELVIKLGYKPDYNHELYDYYKSIHLQVQQI